MSARILTAVGNAFLFRNELVRTALGQVIPGPALKNDHSRPLHVVGLTAAPNSAAPLVIHDEATSLS